MSRPWERLPVDCDGSFAAFQEYRDQRSPRRLRPPIEQCRRWYEENGWRERVSQYDAYMDSVMLEEREATLRQGSKEVSAEHMAVLKDLRAVAVREAEKFVRACNESEMPLITKASELGKFVETIVKMDRLVRGEVTERVEETTDLSKLSVEEMQEMRKLLLKASVKT